VPAYPWDRQPKESEEAYAAFLTYRDMGDGRTVVDAYRQSERKPNAKQADGTWNRWAKSFGWSGRASAWDNHLQHERDGVKAAEVRKLEQRRQQLKDYHWENATKLQEKLAQMLAFPVARREVERDGKVTIIHPARWSFSTAVKLAHAVAALGTLALAPDPAADADGLTKHIDDLLSDVDDPDSDPPDPAPGGP
jgi:hypothetical protein